MAQFGLMGQRHRRRHLNAEVNIINLVDVMLVLLIIFMVTAPIMAGGVKVRLPKAEVRPIDLNQTMMVTVDRGGQVSIDNSPSTSYSRFQATLPSLVATRHPHNVAIRGDDGAPYGAVLRVIATIKAAGIDNVGLVAESESGH
jgi:biopolymer transport protein TolR